MIDTNTDPASGWRPRLRSAYVSARTDAEYPDELAPGEFGPCRPDAAVVATRPAVLNAGFPGVDDLVVAVFAVRPVASPTADQDVITRAADENVVTFFAEQNVVSTETADHIVT